MTTDVLNVPVQGCDNSAQSPISVPFSESTIGREHDFGTVPLSRNVNPAGPRLLTGLSHADSCSEYGCGIASRSKLFSGAPSSARRC